MMRKLLVLGGVLLLAACGGNPNVAPNVSWGYGANGGDPLAYNGPAPQYSFANGLGQDMPVTATNSPQVSYGYGADQLTGVMEQMTPAAQAQQHFASPAPAPTHPAIAPAQTSHL